MSETNSGGKSPNDDDASDEPFTNIDGYDDTDELIEEEDDPVAETAPEPGEWYFPTIEFGAAEDTDFFNRIVEMKHDFLFQKMNTAGVSPPPKTRTYIENQIRILQRFDDVLSAADGGVQLTFKSPAELNVALVACTFAQTAVKDGDVDNADKKISHIAEIASVLADNHWHDDVMDFAAGPYDGSTDGGASA